jgi:hypothetical protein
VSAIFWTTVSRSIPCQANVSKIPRREPSFFPKNVSHEGRETPPWPKTGRGFSFRGARFLRSQSRVSSRQASALMGSVILTWPSSRPESHLLIRGPSAPPRDSPSRWGTSGGPTCFPSGALITTHSEEALDGGFPRPRPPWQVKHWGGVLVMAVKFAVPELRIQFVVRVRA